MRINKMVVDKCYLEPLVKQGGIRNHESCVTAARPSPVIIDIVEKLLNEIVEVSNMKKPPLCPCCSGKTYAVCCKRFLEGKFLPETAEQLMRSRYSSYAKSNKAYLLKTWHSSTRPDALNLDKGLKWVKLQITRTVGGQPSDIEGLVEFEATYLHYGSKSVMRESSRFVFEHGQWLYVNGE